jgi:hypothetical protein
VLLHGFIHAFELIKPLVGLVLHLLCLLAVHGLLLLHIGLQVIDFIIFLLVFLISEVNLSLVVDQLQLELLVLSVEPIQLLPHGVRLRFNS